jgi:hypothetical protein
VICAFYGLIRRLLPTNLLKSISTWIQLLSFGACIAIPLFFPSFLRTLLTARFENSQWTWLPLTWFVEIGRIGCVGTSWQIGSQGALSIIASIVIIWFGLRSFAGTYMLEATSMVQGRFGRTHKRGVLSRGGTAVIHTVTGSSLGLGAFCFISKMIRRDWQFRRAILTQTWIPILIIAGLIIALFRFDNPWNAYFLPHLLGLIAIVGCINLPFTDFSRGSWIYLTAPIGSVQAFARGVFWALWIPAAGLPTIAVALILARFLNWKDAAFIAGYDLIVVSLYLSYGIRLITGLPFSAQMNESKAMTNSIHIQICWLAAILIPFMVHETLFEHLWTAALSAIVLLVVIRFVLAANLGKLEKEILWRLYIMKMGTNQMFREYE